MLYFQCVIVYQLLREILQNILLSTRFCKFKSESRYFYSQVWLETLQMPPLFPYNFYELAQNQFHSLLLFVTAMYSFGGLALKSTNNNTVIVHASVPSVLPYENSHSGHFGVLEGML
jgi:hypothetical protein